MTESEVKKIAECLLDSVFEMDVKLEEQDLLFIAHAYHRLEKAFPEVRWDPF